MAPAEKSPRRYTPMTRVTLTSGRGDTVVVKAHAPESLLLASDFDAYKARIRGLLRQARDYTEKWAIHAFDLNAHDCVSAIDAELEEKQE